MNYSVIIPAAGQGKRMGADKNKLLLLLNKQPILLHTLLVFEQDEHCTEIILVINKEDKENILHILTLHSFTTEITIIYGGAERQYSVIHGVNAVKKNEYVLVHDGARPFITHDIIKRLLEASKTSGGAICAVPVKDTIKRVENEMVAETLERANLWSVQTPQAFSLALLKEAHQRATEEKFLATDEASLVERIGKQVVIVMGDYKNIKITTPEDLEIAENFIKDKKI
jgi:2-C-methyl-D-erythritol 4-phosphate cytidylyltransferase